MHRARSGPSTSANGHGQHNFPGTTRRHHSHRHRQPAQPQTGGAIGTVTQRGRHVGLADQTTLMEAWRSRFGHTHTPGLSETGSCCATAVGGRSASVIARVREGAVRPCASGACDAESGGKAGRAGSSIRARRLRHPATRRARASHAGGSWSPRCHRARSRVRRRRGRRRVRVRTSRPPRDVAQRLGGPRLRCSGAPGSLYDDRGGPAVVAGGAKAAVEDVGRAQGVLECEARSLDALVARGCAAGGGRGTTSCLPDRERKASGRGEASGAPADHGGACDGEGGCKAGRGPAGLVHTRAQRGGVEGLGFVAGVDGRDRDREPGRGDALAAPPL